MPTGYHINESDGLITVEVAGSVDLGDIFEGARQFLADPSYDPNLPQLVDLRGMDIAWQATTIKPFTQFMLQNYAPQARACVAVVVDPELDGDTCARVYWLSCALGNSEVFDSYELALKWLMKQGFAQSPEVIQSQAAIGN